MPEIKNNTLIDSEKPIRSKPTNSVVQANTNRMCHKLNALLATKNACVQKYTPHHIM